MKRVQTTTVLLILVVVLVFAGLGAGASSLVLGQAQTVRISAEFEAERLAARALESLRTTPLSEVAESDPRIVGIALYHPDGTQASAVGPAPLTVKPGILDSRFHFDDRTRVLELIRAIGLHGMRSAPKKAFHPDFGPHPLSENGYVFLSLNEDPVFRTLVLYQWGAWVLPGLVAALAVVFGFLVVANLRMSRRAEERDHLARLGESARTLVHEIRNPLGALRIQTGLLRQRFPDQGLGELQALEEEIDRLNTLTRKVSGFLKDPVGNPEALDLRGLVQTLAERFQLSVSPGAAPGKLTVFVDRDRLMSILENLVRNAWESYPGGTGPVEAELGVHGRRAFVTIRDHGAGIAPEIRARIFDPFFTTKPEGSGIGLALAKRFVEAAQGRLTLEAAPEGGTVARVVLPIRSRG